MPRNHFKFVELFRILAETSQILLKEKIAMLKSLLQILPDALRAGR